MCSIVINWHIQVKRRSRCDVDKSCHTGGWTQGLPHATRMLCHCATHPMQRMLHGIIIGVCVCGFSHHPDLKAKLGQPRHPNNTGNTHTQTSSLYSGRPDFQTQIPTKSGERGRRRSQTWSQSQWLHTEEQRAGHTKHRQLTVCTGPP